LAACWLLPTYNKSDESNALVAPSGDDVLIEEEEKKVRRSQILRGSVSRHTVVSPAAMSEPLSLPLPDCPVTSRGNAFAAAQTSTTRTTGGGLSRPVMPRQRPCHADRDEVPRGAEQHQSQTTPLATPHSPLTPMTNLRACHIRLLRAVKARRKRCRRWWDPHSG